MASGGELQLQDFGIGRLFWRIHEAVIVGDADTGQIVLWNPAAEALFGYADIEVIGQPIEILIPEQLRARHRAGLARFGVTGRSDLMDADLGLELPAVHKSGHLLTIELLLSPIDDVPGGGRFVLAVIRDVTARKRAEDQRVELAREQAARAGVEAAEHARAYLAAIVASSTDAIIGKTLDGEIVSWNAAAEHLYGYTSDEVIGRSIALLIPPDLPDELLSILELVRRGQRVAQHETVRICKDGRRRNVSVSVSPIRNERGEILGAATIARDITERKQAEAERQRLIDNLAAAEDRYRRLFGAVGDALVVADDEGRFIEVNDAMCALVGYTRDELLTMRVGYLSVRGPQRAGEAFQALRETGSWRGEPDLRRKDGSVVNAESVMTTVELPTGRGYLAVHRDVSQRRRLERMQREFIANASHELRNPLGAIRGFAQLMERRGAYSEHSVTSIIDQTRHLERLIGDLLDASRLEAGVLELRPEPLDLVQQARACAEEAQVTSDRHAIRVEAPEYPVGGSWDADRLSQIFRNLLSNAIKYSPDGGEILMRIEDRGDEAEVSIRDHGLGIEAEALSSLFHRFYRVEASSSIKGLGLGLYITKELVEAHGGRIRAESDGPGRGSTFSFTLPVGAAMSTRTEAAQA